MLDQILATTTISGIFMMVLFIPSLFIGKSNEEITKIPLRQSCYTSSELRLKRISNLQKSINAILIADPDLTPHRRESELAK